jgi:hypothetical protein
MVPLYLIFTNGLPVPPISLEVQIWCLIQKHLSFNLVAVILATDWPVSLLIALQMFAMASLSSSDRVLASLSICTSCRVVAAFVLKPNSWLYHWRKFSWVSLSLAIYQFVVLVLAIKTQYYMWLLLVLSVLLIVECNVEWSCCGGCSFAACHAESVGSDELRKLGHRPGGYGNAVEDYWPRPGRSLMRAHPYSSRLSNIKALKLVKAVAGLEK